MSFDRDELKQQAKRAFFVYCLHVAVVLLFLAVSMGGYQLYGSSVLRLPIFLILVFMAALVNVRLCPAWLAFTGGMLIDFFQEGPLGIYAIGFTVVLLSVGRRGPMLLASSFQKIWMTFTIQAAFVLILPWLILSLLNGFWYSPAPVIIGTAALSVLFPILFKPLYTFALKLEPNAEDRLL